jgi:predicted Zn-dependent protease
VAKNGDREPKRRPGLLSTHPNGLNRIKELQANVSKVMGLYERTRRV